MDFKFEWGKRWRESLKHSGKEGPYKKTLFNILIPLRRSPEWRDVLHYNAFSHNIEVHKQLPWQKGLFDSKKLYVWTDYDDFMLTEWLQKEAIDINSKLVSNAVFTVAKEHEFHPVREYFAGIKWDEDQTS